MRLSGGMSYVQVVVGDEGRLQSVDVDRFGLSVELLVQAPEDSVSARVGRCKMLYECVRVRQLISCGEEISWDA